MIQKVLHEYFHHSRRVNTLQKLIQFRFHFLQGYQRLPKVIGVSDSHLQKPAILLGGHQKIPYYSGKNIIIFCGGLLHLAAECPQNSVHLFITEKSQLMLL